MNRAFLWVALLGWSVPGLAGHGVNWSELHQNLDRNCKSSKDPVCVGHELLYALEKSTVSGGGTGWQPALGCTCDDYGYIRCSLTGSPGAISQALDLGSQSDCTQVKPIAERKGLACDDYGYIYRFDRAKVQFVKGEDLGSREDCVQQIL